MLQRLLGESDIELKTERHLGTNEGEGVRGIFQATRTKTQKRDHVCQRITQNIHQHKFCSAIST